MRSHLPVPSRRARSFTLRRATVAAATAVALVGSGAWSPIHDVRSTPVASVSSVSSVSKVSKAAPARATEHAGPSGKAMPQGDLKRWRQVFRDDFRGSKLRKPWTKYDGMPGGDPDGRWKRSHAVVSGGSLKLKTYKENGRWVSAGVGSWNGMSMKYGRIDVRFRAKQAKGVAYTLLLWPKNGPWPPEVDFAEDGGGNRHGTTATLHHGATNNQVQRHLSANFSKWHTMGVRWSPGKLVYTLDGKVWATVKHRGVPNTTMVLAMQTQTWSCDIPWYVCPGASTPKRSSVDIDWVVAYKRR